MKRELPHAWTRVALSEVVGPPQYGTSAANVVDGEVPIVGMKDMSRGRVDVSALARANPSPRERAALRLRRGDLLLNRTNSRDLVGKLAVWDYSESIEAIFASYLVRFCEVPTVASTRYVLACLEQAQAQQQIDRLITTGVSQANINPSAFFEEVEIPLAPLSEQRKIVAALEVWERSIDRVERLIAAKGQLLNALIRSIFHATDQEGVPAPAGWRRVCIGDLARIVGGGTPGTGDPALWNGEVLWCTPTDLSSLKCRFIDDTNRHITEAGLRASSASILPSGSIILCSRASVGMCAINRAPMSTNQGFQSLVPKANTDTAFIYYLIRSSERRLIRMAAGSTFLEFSGRELAKLSAVVPDIQEQRRIGAMLSAMDDGIDCLSLHLDRLRTQKRGLMQKLLSGEWRLREPEIVS